MTGKTLQNGNAKLPTTMDALREKVLAKYESVLFEHPNGYGNFELAMLRRREREIIINRVNIDGKWDNLLQGRMTVAYGLIAPRLVTPGEDGLPINATDDQIAEATMVALESYPDDFIDPLSAEVWRMSNEYLEKNRKGGSNSTPFPKTSGLSTGSSTEPTSIQKLSKGGRTSEEIESSSGS